jgi:hypothetical protein
MRPFIFAYRATARNKQSQRSNLFYITKLSFELFSFALPWLVPPRQEAQVNGGEKKLILLAILSFSTP